jgi:uncharacterized membrane protein YeaQ/YmgE (transglycosylase-associated protein family)
VSIRDCVATPSTIVLFLEGDLDPESLQRYEVVKADGSDTPIVVDSLAEVDLRAGLSVFRNPVVPPARIGDWLRVDLLGPIASDPEATYFVRVRSDLPWSRVGLTERHGAPKDTIPASRRRAGLSRDPALLVVVAGLVVLVVLGVVAMPLASARDMGTIATAAFGVIGSVVGAFFGVRAGLGDRERVQRELQLEATKGQMLAAMMPEKSKKEALEILEAYAPERTESGRA